MKTLLSKSFFNMWDGRYDGASRRKKNDLRPLTDSSTSDSVQFRLTDDWKAPTEFRLKQASFF
jgi:hypothetical protein